MNSIPEPEDVIDCIDCGGRAHLVSYSPELGWAAGDLVTYRCEECLDRWDLVLPEREVPNLDERA